MPSRRREDFLAREPANRDLFFEALRGGSWGPSETGQNLAQHKKLKLTLSRDTSARHADANGSSLSYAGYEPVHVGLCQFSLFALRHLSPEVEIIRAASLFAEFEAALLPISRASSEVPHTAHCGW